ncbi:hypothetical protein RyT2_09030 [Pseudolactococcus yaeyamensis]
MDINNFPDILVDKEYLIDNFFPSFKMKTLEKYLTAIRKTPEFEDILTRSSTRKTLINPKGFFLYLKYRESKMYQ